MNVRPYVEYTTQDAADVGESLLIILVVGLVAGWLAGQIVKAPGLGLSVTSLSESSAPSLAVGCCRN